MLLIVTQKHLLAGAGLDTVYTFSEKLLHIREAIRYDSGLFRRSDKRQTNRIR